MQLKRLNLVGVRVEPPAREAIAGGAAAGARLNVIVEVENQTTAPLYAWSSERGYDYDAASKVLTLHLSEQPRVLPPGIILISDHPRAPAQVEVAPNSRTSIRVQLPAVVRRAAAGGTGWVEEPIGEIAQIDVDLQYGTAPIESARPHETSAQFRSRMREHGDVARATLTPYSGGAAPRQKE
jgi:hypothetical protein